MQKREYEQNTPKVRQALGADEARAALVPWLQGKLGKAENFALTELSMPTGVSFSSDILLLQAEWRMSGDQQGGRFVVRLAPRTNTLFPAPDIGRDFAIATALYKLQCLPLPKPYWLETDTSILGAPFYVMQRLDGRAAPDNPPYNVAGWVADASADDRASLWWAGIEAMAKLHRIDWQAAGLGFMQRADTPRDELAHDLDCYAKHYDWACEGKRLDYVDAAALWLLTNMPEVGQLGFCWGDARLGNLLFHEGKCNAVLDWEMATLGEAEKDLAYWLFFDRYNREGTGAPSRQGWPTHEETLAKYERLLGRPLRNLRYYEVFANYRMAVIMTRMIRLTDALGLLPNADQVLENHFFMTSLRDAFA